MPANVLFLHAAGDWLRGSENVLLTIFRGMDRSVLHPYLLTSNASLADAARQEGIETEVQLLPDIAIEDGDVRLPVRNWTKAIWKIARMIREKKMEAIYCNGGSTAQIGYYAAKFSGIPVIAHLHAPIELRLSSNLRQPRDTAIRSSETVVPRSVRRCSQRC
jgi:hypothetical protein